MKGKVPGLGNQDLGLMSDQGWRPISLSPAPGASQGDGRDWQRVRSRPDECEGTLGGASGFVSEIDEVWGLHFSEPCPWALQGDGRDPFGDARDGLTKGAPVSLGVTNSA
jgi:hypothetical protein